jgi:hypothetical protein
MLQSPQRGKQLNRPSVAGSICGSGCQQSLLASPSAPLAERCSDRCSTDLNAEMGDLTGVGPLGVSIAHSLSTLHF